MSVTLVGGCPGQWEEALPCPEVPGQASVTQFGVSLSPLTYDGVCFWVL